jgi:hypothetical protein
MGWPPTVSLHAIYSIEDLEDVRERLGSQRGEASWQCGQ